MNPLVRSQKKALWACVFAIQTLTFPLIADQQIASPREALMLRRIAEYWKDGDWATVKKQVIAFLTKYPTTPLKDQLNAMLGDIYLQEGKFEEAYTVYEQIEKSEMKSKVLFNRLQCLFELKQYQRVIQASERYFQESWTANEERDVKVRLLLAESLFREAFHEKNQEKKATLLNDAKPQYKILTKTKYADRALFPLAEIHRSLGEYEQAVPLYVHLSEKYPKHREKFLFQAALLQLNFDKGAASQSFAKIAELGGNRSALAAYNHLLLLFQAEQFADFITAYEKVVDRLPKEKLPFLQFYVGKSHYALSEWAKAASSLETFTAQATTASKEKKTALLLLINCARQLQDVALLDRSVKTLEENYANAVEVPKALLIHARMSREVGNIEQSLGDLKRVLNTYPHFEEKESVLYDYALLLSQSRNWPESRLAFDSFVKQYPKSDRATKAWRHLLNCCIEELNTAENKEDHHLKENFIFVLQSILERNDILNTEERTQWHFNLVKGLYELGKYDQAVPQLENFLATTQDDTRRAEAHLLMALTQQSRHKNSLFIIHAEKALELNADLPEKQILLLELFNAYLAASFEEQDSKIREALLDHAANHLFESHSWEEKAIKRDNFLWLSDHYYQKALSESKNGFAFERATLLFKKLLGWEGEEPLFKLTAENGFLEKEAYKFATMLDHWEQKEQEITLLETLIGQQERITELTWETKYPALYLLGRAYQSKGDEQGALKAYESILEDSDRAPLDIAYSAQLEEARLKYHLLPREEKQADSPEVMEILDSLKELQIQKKLSLEPVHLEAAIEYAEIRGHLVDQDSKTKTALFFYQRIKEDFNSEKDPVTRAYHADQADFPGQYRLSRSYLSFVDAEILKLEAEIAKMENDEERYRELATQAMSQFKRLLTQSEPLTPYLITRTKRSMEEMDITL